MTLGEEIILSLFHPAGLKSLSKLTSNVEEAPGWKELKCFHKFGDGALQWIFLLLP